MLCIEATNPGLMKLSRFGQKPLRRERFAVRGLHGCSAQDTVPRSMETAVGRRVLVAVVAGTLGDQIQAWRERYDARQAARLPPHLTVCYRPPAEADLGLIEAQVRYAFAAPVTVRLGGVFVLAHSEAPLAVSVHDTAQLDAARQRLFDGTHVQMAGRHEWPWHITCVRYGHARDREALLAAAASELALDALWQIESISYLELREARYQPVAEWDLKLTPACSAARRSA
jgi:hypothetical protein